MNTQLMVLSPYAQDRYKKFELKQTRLTTSFQGNTKFEIDAFFEIVALIGEGAYGKVVAAKKAQVSDQQTQSLETEEEEKVTIAQTVQCETLDE